MKPIVVGLGYKARNGKGEFANTIRDTFANVEVMSFSDALRAEIKAGAIQAWERVYTYNKTEFTGPEALRLLCVEHHQPFDPDAPVEANYPWGKQRKLLQYWGTEYRRAQDPDYWLKKVGDRIAASNARMIIIDDLRFPNEFDFIGKLGGYRIKLTRLNFESGVPNHISETSLDGVKFDIEYSIPDGHLYLLRELAAATFVGLFTDNLSAVPTPV